MLDIYIKRIVGQDTDEVVHRFPEVDEIVEITSTSVKLKVGTDQIIWIVKDDEFLMISNMYV